MGAVASGFEKANNAAMFSATDTINQGFQQMDVAAMGAAYGRQQAQQQSNISAQYGVGMGGGMGQPYQPWMGYASFNQFLYAIGYLLLGVFAIGFGVTYFVEMAEKLTMSLSTIFFFFFFHHFIYTVMRLETGGNALPTSSGIGIVTTAIVLGAGAGAVWTYYILDRIRDKEAADYTIGISMGVLLLFLLSTWSYGRMNYAWRSTGVQYANAAQPMGAQPMAAQPMVGPPGGGARVAPQIAN